MEDEILFLLVFWGIVLAAILTAGIVLSVKRNAKYRELWRKHAVYTTARVIKLTPGGLDPQTCRQCAYRMNIEFETTSWGHTRTEHTYLCTGRRSIRKYKETVPIAYIPQYLLHYHGHMTRQEMLEQTGYGGYPYYHLVLFAEDLPAGISKKS